jgi:hypothetical protein
MWIVAPEILCFAIPFFCFYIMHDLIRMMIASSETLMDKGFQKMHIIYCGMEW